MQDACTANEHAGRKSTSVTCVTEVGLHRSLNPRTRWPISQYEWIKTSAILTARGREETGFGDRLESPLQGVRARTRQ
eukprot:4162564-Pleurochrysis_carterae.AAC.1